jgi:basic amino acid/polyamine antiporter, APA family
MATDRGTTATEVPEVPVTLARDRQLGLPMTIALVVGNMIGSGIFLLPAALAPFGQIAIYGWLLTIAGVLCVAGVLTILSAQMEGGPFAYVERALGPTAAFLVMWAYLIGVWTGLPAIAIAGVSYLSRIAPAIGQTGIAPLVAIAFQWAFIAINARSTRSAGSVQLITSILKVIPLIAVALVAAAALGGGGHSAEQSAVPFSGGALAGAAALALFSMLGFESATMPADKIRDAKRTVPIATMGGVLLTGIIYIATYAAVLFLLSGAKTAASPAPLADAIAPVLGPIAGTAIALFAAISAFGCVNGWVLVAGEIPLCLARDGAFPKWFAKTTRLDTPVRALVLAGVVSTLLVLANYSKSMSGLFAFFALVTTVSSLFLYVTVSVAALVHFKERRIQSAILPVVAIPGLIFALWAFWGAGLEPSLWGLALLASGVPIYWLMRRGDRSSREPELAPAAPPGSSS